MSKKSPKTVKTADGGFMSIEEKNGGFRISIQRGFKETPEERKERIRLSRRGGFHKDKRREPRSAVRRKLKEMDDE